MTDTPSHDPSATLDHYFQRVRRIILARQDPVTGLLPASTAINAHGDYTDAWVRDNVYSILAAWGLGLAYRRRDDHRGRAVLLEQSVVKLMRGLLTAMMRQSAKVEAFKYSQDPLDALHAKYDTGTGDPVVGDDQWGHLQLDATSLYLLMLVQMTTSGLRIIFTPDEVDFIQNLVHYIGRAYRTPDYGIWERGNKINRGIAEVNSSSVGMAKAALEALDGFNCLGPEGPDEAVIQVIPDEIARARITLHSALPGESLSKEVDAATLSVIGFPAFAVDDPALIDETLDAVEGKLEGRYGCKRFLRDGHQTVLEDPHRLHYEPEELKRFEHIECEWPLFFTYLLLHHLFAGDNKRARDYRQRLESLLVERDGEMLLPELYIVPADRVAAEQAAPGSQQREPNDNVPLVWAQSLYTLGALIQDGLLDPFDVDPLARHLRAHRNQGKPIQLALVADDESVRATLSDYGLVTQTRAEVSPLRIRPAGHLALALGELGRNARLGLSGRPPRHPRGLATACIYTADQERTIFEPQFMNRHDFYLTLDSTMLVERLRMEMAYIYRQWDLPGRPLMLLSVDQRMLGPDGGPALITFIRECQQGAIEGARVRLGRVKDFFPTACIRPLVAGSEHLFPAIDATDRERPCFLLMPLDAAAAPRSEGEDLHTWPDEALISALSDHEHPLDHYRILETLSQRHGIGFDTGLLDAENQTARVADLLEELFIRAGDLRHWRMVRRCAALLGKHDIDLEGAVTEIIVSKIALSVSRLYSRHATLRQPAGASEILDMIRRFNADDMRAQILIQELILNLGFLVRSHPHLVADLSIIRSGQLLQLLAARVRQLRQCDSDDAIDVLMGQAPHEIAQALRDVLEHTAEIQDQLYQAEQMHFSGDVEGLRLPVFRPENDPDRGESRDWLDWRHVQGSVGRYPRAFYEGVWDIIERSGGLVIGDEWNPKRRLDHSLSLDMTRGEQLFQDATENLLNKTPLPEQRWIYYESLMVIASLFQANPDLRMHDTMVLDVIVGHGVRLHWLQESGADAGTYPIHREAAWAAFQKLPPHELSNRITEAFLHLLHGTDQAAG
ncbi:MAG: glycoside hydrolase family 15 protein [Gammaproteobacteria bacterium]